MDENKLFTITLSLSSKEWENHLSRGFNGAGGVTGWPKRVVEDRPDLVELVGMIGCV